MTDPFRERGKGFEAKYEQDEAIRFRVVTRRNKLLGLWVAGQIGLSGKAAEAYAQEMVDHDLVHPAEDSVLAKAQADMTAKGLTISRHRLDLRLAKLLQEAEEQVHGEIAGTPLH
ncbi:DUF1476 domain-containing protein [Roseospira visakhapatnamensis]|uniref:DUF1476 domain-containing protein n=1 Tax=Roseospira visakhapatnamensis TaxID=390880 RepID=A0A7W6RFB5_9PROT|nr:DUF1476 domain-containing protein [Roseospira visakhapatnamensis]MBB4267267.1 hypothetical protein [Roseospira visakhapatnamensis]